MNIELLLTIIAALLVARLLAPLTDKFSAYLFGNPTHAHKAVKSSASTDRGSIGTRRS